ncbi:MAG: arginine N-succinyltransferase [Herminiimonas sp.]|nr:arginine N-succinyltransferase [Herminiimonas sp.]
MLVVRAVTRSDLDGLMALAALVGDGMTTLKADLRMLGERIDIACASFAETIEPAARDYVFVMEDTDTATVVGVCAIKAAVGLREPFYNYRIGTLVHSSIELGIFSRMETLHLSNDLTGCAELCSLFLHPNYRSGSNGKLLSKSRFLFLALFPALFPQTVIAEMRGFQRPDGVSPFWENLGRHFFQMDFKRADDLSSLGKKSFIAELMPRHPLYVAYLPREAQEVIGRVHVDTAPARYLLEQEGMFYAGYVDIFDAGPVLQARLADLRAARENVLVGITVSAGTIADQAGAALVSTTSLAGFRALVAAAPAPAVALCLTPAQAQQLGVSAGAQVCHMPLGAKQHAVA